MKADTYNLIKIFGQQARYVVPLFQRPYVWNQKLNWEPLWEDIRRVANEVEQGSNVHPHFLGAIVLGSIGPEFGQLTTWEVIDGQQRLTTLQVFHAAARAAAESIGADQAAETIGLFIDNPAVLVPGDHPEGRWKVWPTRADQHAFADAMTDAAGSEQLVAARLWFQTQIMSWIQEGIDAPSRLSALITALRERLRLVVIDLEKDDDAQVIFETLNGRGTPLEAADLVKNLLFRIAQQHGEDVDELYGTWAPFDKDAWRRQITVGRQYRSRLDVFLTHWLSMRTTREVTASTLYAGFSDWMDEHKPVPGDVFDELARYAAIYDSFETQDETTLTGRFFQRLQAHQTTTVIPLLLHVWGQGADVSEAQRQRILVAIDSLLMRRAVLALTTKDYNNLFREVLVAAAAANSASVDTVIVNALASGTAESSYWPNDDAFRKTLEGSPLYKTMYRSRLRSLLEGIEHELRQSPNVEQLSAAKKLTVEHVLPQSWRGTAWPLPASTSEEERDLALHTLGNLTLVTGSANAGLSNNAWTTKRDWIGPRSLLLLTIGSVLHAPYGASIPANEWASDWDEMRIAERGRYLADLALQIWPSAAELGASAETPAPPVPIVDTPAAEPLTGPGKGNPTQAAIDTKDLLMTCRVCGEAKRGSSFPTIQNLANRPGEFPREDECRACRDRRYAEGREAGGKNELYRAFWEKYLTHVRASHPEWTRATQAPAQSWFPMTSGIPGCSIIASFAAGGRLRHELYIDRSTAEECKALFDVLAAQQIELESAYGSPLEWERLDHRKASRIAEYADGDVAQEERHDEYIAFFEDAAVRLRAALIAVDSAVGD